MRFITNILSLGMGVVRLLDGHDHGGPWSPGEKWARSADLGSLAWVGARWAQGGCGGKGEEGPGKCPENR